MIGEVRRGSVKTKDDKIDGPQQHPGTIRALPDRDEILIRFDEGNQSARHFAQLNRKKGFLLVAILVLLSVLSAQAFGLYRRLTYRDGQ